MMISSFLREKLRSSTAGSIENIGSPDKFMSRASIPRATVGSSKPSYSDAMVTIVMRIKFDHNSVDVGVQYHRDLAKLASFLKGNPSLTATLEGQLITNTSLATADIAKLRLQNVMDYLVNNFGVSRTQFYEEKSAKPALGNENFAEKAIRDSCGVTIVLKYP